MSVCSLVSMEKSVVVDVGNDTMHAGSDGSGSVSQDATSPAKPQHSFVRGFKWVFAWETLSLIGGDIKGA